MRFCKLVLAAAGADARHRTYHMLRLDQVMRSRVCEATGQPMVPTLHPSQIFVIVQSLLTHLSIFASGGLGASDHCMFVRRTEGVVKQLRRVRTTPAFDVAPERTLHLITQGMLPSTIDPD